MKSKCVKNAFYQLAEVYGKTLFLIGGLLLCFNSYAQIGINTGDPNATLEIIAQKKPQTPDGLLVPRLTASETQSMSTSLTEKQNSLLIYVTQTFTTVPTTGKCVNIDSEGYYFYDHSNGAVWKKLGTVVGGGNYTAGAGIKIASGVISATGLESVPLGISNAWRLIGENLTKHFSPGRKAIDMSTYAAASTLIGAKGKYSVAIGYDNIAEGDVSVAIGMENKAKGWVSLALGYNNTSNGLYSLAIGENNTSNERYSHAIGYNNTSGGSYSLAIGDSNNSTNVSYAYTIGRGNQVNAEISMAIGFYNQPYDNNIFSIGTGSNESSRKNAFVISRSRYSGKNYVAIGRDKVDLNINALLQVNGLIESSDIYSTEPDPTDIKNAKVVVAGQDGVLKTLDKDEFSGKVYLPSYKGKGGNNEIIYKPFSGLYGSYFRGTDKFIGGECWKYIGYAKLISFLDIDDSTTDKQLPKFKTITAPKRLAPYVGGEYYVKNIPLNIVINPVYSPSIAAGQINSIFYEAGKGLWREHGRIIYPIDRDNYNYSFDYQGSSFILAIMHYRIGGFDADLGVRKMNIEFIPYSPSMFSTIRSYSPSRADTTDNAGRYYYPVLLQPKLVVQPAEEVLWNEHE